MIRLLERIKSSKFIKKIPFIWKLKLQYILSIVSNKNDLPFLLRNELKIIVALAADYGNLGDVAITFGQIYFLRMNFPNYKIIPIYMNDVYMLYKLKKWITSKDIITTIGGGNMGDVYEGYEARRRFIIKLFSDNKIISFPQSIDFKRKESLNKSIKAYSKHKNLHIFAREPISFEIMKESFIKNHVYLVPDIVLNLNKAEPKLIRDGVTLCLRNDLEGKISFAQKESLMQSIKKKYVKVRFYDTYLNHFRKEDGEVELKNIWDAFKSTGVVVTDRLHGMIFCAITKTPCIVLPNSNHKISGTYYKWLAKISYIKFIENFDEKKILELIDIIYDINIDEEYTGLNVNELYEPLLNVLNSK